MIYIRKLFHVSDYKQDSANRVPPPRGIRCKSVLRSDNFVRGNTDIAWFGVGFSPNVQKQTEIGLVVGTKFARQWAIPAKQLSWLALRVAVGCHVK